MLQKPHTLVLILTLLASTPLFAQPGHNWYQCNVSPGARSVLVERFDAVLKDGQYIAGKPSITGGDIYGYPTNCRLIFKPNGLLHKRILHKYGAPYGAYNNYVYNFDYQLLKKELITTQKRKRRSVLHTCHYYGKNKVLKALTNGIDRFVYKEGVFRTALYGEIALESDSLNPHGQIVRALRKRPNGDNVFTQTNTYSHNGLLLKALWSRDVYRANTQKIAYVYNKEYTYRYTYNDRGDWTRAIIRLDGTPVMIVKRTIRYMDIAPRPDNGNEFDRKVSLISGDLLATTSNIKHVRKMQDLIEKFRTHYINTLDTLAHMDPKLLDNPRYRAFIAQDTLRQRYLDTYCAFASNLTSHQPTGIPRADFDDIIRPDLRWAGWKSRKVTTACPGVQLYEMRHKGYTICLALNTMPASAANDLEFEYILDGETTSHHCALKAGEYSILSTGGGDDNKVYRKVLSIQKKERLIALQAGLHDSLDTFNLRAAI